MHNNAIKVKYFYYVYRSGEQIWFLSINFELITLILVIEGIN